VGGAARDRGAAKERGAARAAYAEVRHAGGVPGGEWLVERGRALEGVLPCTSGRAWGHAGDEAAGEGARARAVRRGRAARQRREQCVRRTRKVVTREVSHVVSGWLNAAAPEKVNCHAQAGG
jgi:hypothetical protein